MHQPENQPICRTGSSGILTKSLFKSDFVCIIKDLPAGTIVFKYLGPNYGIGCEPDRVNVTLEPREYPFFPIPAEAVNWD